MVYVRAFMWLMINSLPLIQLMGGIRKLNSLTRSYTLDLPKMDKSGGEEEIPLTSSERGDYMMYYNFSVKGQDN